MAEKLNIRLDVVVVLDTVEELVTCKANWFFIISFQIVKKLEKLLTIVVDVQTSLKDCLHRGARPLQVFQQPFLGQAVRQWQGQELFRHGRWSVNQEVLQWRAVVLKCSAMAESLTLMESVQ